MNKTNHTQFLSCGCAAIVIDADGHVENAWTGSKLLRRLRKHLHIV